MTVKEFTLKTFAFIIFPGLLVYGVRSCQAAGDEQLATFRACVRDIRRTPPLALTIYGAQEERLLKAPAVLRQLPQRAAALRWVYMPIGEYRAPPRNYRVSVTMPRQPVRDIYLNQTATGKEVVTWGGDSVYLDKQRRFFPFIDSLYQHTAATPKPVPTINLP